jgi:hypothetical protein
MLTTVSMLDRRAVRAGLRACLRLPAGLLATVIALVFVPGIAFAQVANIAGTVRDAGGGVLPGVTVEATSPQLIEKVRSTVTDENGRYQIVSLPVGTYTITFKLDRFGTVERGNIQLTSDVTAPVNAEMKIGTQSEVVTVVGQADVVDVTNARQRQVFTGDEVKDLPTTRNLGDLVQLVPGIALSAAAGGTSRPSICSGGQADGGFSGALSGCSPIFEGFNSHASMNDADSINQGRMQVDGLGINSFAGGGRSSYIADVGNAQEITFNLSGALGESETGGATINVVPRTGGNRFAGNYFNAYSSGRFYGKNNETRTSTFSNRLISEYDVNGAYGGPVLRDRLWFYSSARRQSRDNRLAAGWRNLNEGVFGANYVGDPNNTLNQTEIYQNVSTRLTLQATQRNKFNIFWDEQYTCESPCSGPVAGQSVEASGSVLTYPLHLAQLSWTNPITNKILLDAAVSHYGSHRDQTRNRSELAYSSIPRIAESGTSSFYATIPGAVGNAVTSGSINNATDWRNDNIQSRASASYITGSHNIKLGYQGQYLRRTDTPFFNDLRLLYTYATPAATCTATAPTSGTVSNQSWCGLFPDGVTRIYDGRNVSEPLGDPLPTSARPPVPSSFTQYIPAPLDQKAWFTSFYLQDQWTWNRFTLNGALRYDNAQSRFGKTCVGPDRYKPDQYCLNDPDQGEGRGVYFQDITPRWGVAWDAFGNGKTSVKYSMGKYLSGAQIGDVYTASNPAGPGRSVNSLTRTWRDLNGNRVIDCNLVIPAVAPGTAGLPADGECAAVTGAQANNARRFGRSPDDLDDLGLAVGLGTLNCGQNERSMSDFIRNYCNNYFAAGGSSLIDGWNKRENEWQTSIGVQHEILPRLSAEVTYNHRSKGNLRVTDLIGSGCDLYSGTAGVTLDPQPCMQNQLNFQSSFYDFYGIQAPSDPRLPGGGGYVVQGAATAKCATYSTVPGEENVCTATVSIPASAGVNAVTIAPDGSYSDYWSGVDTNFIWRSSRGLRISGGTSTGRRNVDTCGQLVNDPPTGQLLLEGRERDCNRERPFQTNLRGTASYTIPWVDVLLSSVFSIRPGVEIVANYRVDMPDLVWAPNSQDRTGTIFSIPANPEPGTVQQNLLSNDIYGERIALMDIKLAKNIRFKGKRVNIGLDVYNVFNSDAALGYCNTFPNPDRGVEGCGNATAGWRPWRNVDTIMTPRYARFQMQVDF